MIEFDSGKRQFHLRGEHMSYVMQVGTDEQVHHVYWGAKLERVPNFLYNRAPYRRATSVENQPVDSPKCSREYFHYECPTYGMSDFRMPALQAAPQDGVALCDLRYHDYTIYSGRKPIDGLPFAHGDDAETLEIELRDPVNGIGVTLYYHLFGDVMTRHMRVHNGGEGAVKLEQVMSATVDFEDGAFDMLTLDGTTLREFTPSLRPVLPGMTEITSTRGNSSHQHNPNVALLRKGTNQTHGEAYGFSLIYSGNFTLRAEMDQYGSCRFQGGINPFGFCWKLNAGESFESPEIVMSYSAEGLNGLTHVIHPFVLAHVLRGDWQDADRPVLLNTWEACYFKVSHDGLLAIGDKAAEGGIEMLVLDDGWFGHRDNASSSLGDWFVNLNKFPQGIDVLADALAQKNLKMGIWVEPEMISPDSELYRAHPDWCLHAPGRVRTEWRNQLVLDMGRDEVVEYLKGCMDGILSSGKIAYIKWDNNRRLTQAFSEALAADQQGEVFHRFILGTYKLLEHVHTKYPHVLMENCASGGGRFDYGMLNYFHQGWLSDNTDAVCRLGMQNAASIFFPSVTITSHISACPNHQNGRVTPYTFRRDVCALFNAGYELNLFNENMEEVAQSTEQFKALRHTMRTGRFTRLCPDVIPGEWYAWMVEDDEQAVIAYFRPYCEPEAYFWTIPLNGLDANALYCDTRTGETLPGSVWMATGLQPDWHDGDFFSQMIVLKKVKE